MSQSFRVFVVDDDVASTNIIPRLLNPLGYEVVCQNSLKGAFEQAKQIQPQVLLLDVMLGDGVGYQLARRIRKDPELYKISILFVSSLGETPEINHALEQGGDAYLVKPISKEKLVESIENMKQLFLKVSDPDKATGLLSRERLLREVDYRLFRNEGIALCCISFENIKAVFDAAAQNDLESYLKFMGRSIQSLVSGAGVHEFVFSHFGHGTFMLVLPNTSVARVSRLVDEQFEFLSEKAVANVSASKASHAKNIGVRIAFTSTQCQAYQQATEMTGRIKELLDSSRFKGKNLVLEDNRTL